jgi:hypothetical protein
MNGKRMEPWHPWKYVDVDGNSHVPFMPGSIRMVNQTTLAILRAMGKIK